MKDKNINEQKKSKKGKVKNKKKLKTWKKVLLVILLIVLILIGWFTYKTKKNGGGLSGMLATVVGHDENTKKMILHKNFQFFSKILCLFPENMI